LIDQPSSERPGLVPQVLTWRRPALWSPLVGAVHVVREFVLNGVDQVPALRVALTSREKEPMRMPVAKAPAKTPLPEAEAIPSRTRLDAAVRKATSAKTKARDAKAALKKAKKSFRVARKAAKAARKEVEALQAAIARAEEKATAAAKRARATRRAPKTDLSRVAATVTSPPAKPGAARKTRRVSTATSPGADVVYTEALATPTDTVDALPSVTPS
jgi:hypothetical protein